MTCYELIQELDLGEYGEDFTDPTNYSVTNNESDYLSDLFMEFADQKVSPYTPDIVEYISKNPDAVNDVINELGWDGVDRDIIKAAMFAQAKEVEDDLFAHEADIAKKLAYDYLEGKDVYGEDGSWEVPDDIISDIERVCDNGINKMSDISIAVDEALESWKENGEEY